MADVSLLQRVRSWLKAAGETPLVCEIAADYVAALRHRRGQVGAWAVRALPQDTVRPAPLADNVLDRAAIESALEQVVSAVSNGERRCVLLVPDLLARVILLEFDHLPERTDEAEGLVRWRLAKDVPFDLDQASLSYQRQPGRAGRQEVVVAVCHRPLLRQYEECVEKLGLQPGWVTVSTLAAVGWLTTDGNAPRVLVKRDRGSLGLVVVHDEAVRLVRSVPVPHQREAGDEETLFEKIYPAVVYFQDQWGEPVREAYLAGRGKGSDLAQQLERELGCTAVRLQPGELDLPPSPISGAPPDERLVPVLGWARGETK